MTHIYTVIVKDHNDQIQVLLNLGQMQFGALPSIADTPAIIAALEETTKSLKEAMQLYANALKGEQSC